MDQTVQQVAAAASQNVAQDNPVPPLAQSQPVVPPVNDLQEFDAKRIREANTSFGDYATAAVHQDDFLNGFIANHVGESMAVDPTYNVLAPDEWKRVTEGIPPSLQPELLDAHSAAHAFYIRGLLQDKMREQQQLGDLGWKGNTLRIMGGFIEPGNLMVMAGSMGLGAVVGGGSALARASKALKLTTEMAEGPAKVAAVADATAAFQKAAGEASTLKAAASNIGGAGVINAGMEKLRQQYNFEDDPEGVRHAFLMGIGLGAPIAGIGARSMARLRETAGHELAVLNAVQAANEHPTIPQAPPAVEAAKVAELHNHVADVVTGEKPYADLRDPPLSADELASLKDRTHAFEDDAKDHASDLSVMLNQPFDAVPHPSKEGRFIVQPADIKDTFAFKGDAEARAAELSQKYGITFEAQPAGKDGLHTVGVREEPIPEGLRAPEEAPQAAPKAPESAMVSGGSAAVAEGTPRFAGIAPTYMRSGRLDIYATLNKNPNPVFQELAHIAVKDAIGNSKTESQAMSASEIKRNIQRTIGGYFHTEAQGAYYAAAQARQVRMPRFNKTFSDSFYKLVTKVAQGDQEVLRSNPDIAPMLQKAAAAMRDGYERTWARAEKAGVKGTEIVPKLSDYVNRIYDHEAMRKAERTHGEDAVVKAMANSRAISEDTVREAKALGITPEELQFNKVRTYYRAIKKLEFSHMAQDMALYAHDANTLRAELAHAGLSSEAIDSIVTTMFEEHTADPTKGNAGNLKFRFDLDPNYSEMMPNGERLRVGDLFENDSRVLFDRYMNSMAGHIGWAERGIKSRSQYMGRLKDAEDVHAASSNDPKQYAAGRQQLLDLWDNITGRPMSTQEFNTTARIANASRAMTRSMVLGQLGVAAAFEMHKAVVLAGLRSFLMQAPTFRSVLRAVSKGHQFDSALATDIRHLWGFGSEGAASYARQHELTDFDYEKGLTRYENFANEASHIVDHLSGNSFFTSATREMATRMFIQKYADFAAGSKLTAKMRERMVSNGVDAGQIDRMLRDLNAHVERDSGRVTGIRWEDWQQSKPGTFNAFQTVVEREVRDAIQEHDIGETMGFMHTTLGKVFSELRTFMFVGHAKSSLRALHFADSTSLKQLMFGIVSEAMAYSLQTSINYAGNRKELERRMDPAYVAGSIFQRMSLMGVLPGLVQTAMNVAGYQLPGSTANTNNRNFLITPSMQAAQNVLSAGQVVGNALNPFNSSVTTDKEMRQAFQALPFGNGWGMRSLGDWLGQQQPHRDTQVWQR